jgi:hypothetical protein
LAGILIRFYNLENISYYTAATAAQTVAGDMSRRKKVKEKRPSPLLFSSLNIFSVSRDIHKISNGQFSPKKPCPQYSMFW